MVERRANLHLENSPTVEKADLLLEIGNLGNVILRSRLHPEFRRTAMFTMYVIDDKELTPKGSRVSRFQVGKELPKAAIRRVKR